MADDVKWSSGLPQNGSFQHFGRSASHIGTSYGLLALSGGIFAADRLRGDSHLQQTGLAAGEAALHSFVLTFGLKMAATRERPNTGSGQEEFFSGFSQVRKGENSIRWQPGQLLQQSAGSIHAGNTCPGSCMAWLAW